MYQYINEQHEQPKEKDIRTLYVYMTTKYEKGMDSMKTTTRKRFLAVLTTAAIFAAAVPVVQTGYLPLSSPVTAADADSNMTVSSDTVHVPDSLQKENGYIFGVRKVQKGKTKKYFLYYRDATVRGENGEPTGDIVNIQEFDGTLIPKPDYRTMNNLYGESATVSSPATGEKLRVEQAVNAAVEEYFLADGTGAWYTTVDKQEKTAIPMVMLDDQKTQEPGIIVEPEIPQTKCLKENKQFIDLLIKAYDAEEGHEEDNSFLNDPSMSYTDDNNVEITDEGYEELLRIFKSDVKGFTGKVTDIKKSYSAVVANAQAKELNSMNREINSSDEVDLEKVKWVMETKPEGEEGTASSYPKTNSNAKFWGKKGTSNTATALTEASGSSAVVSQTTANGKFNNVVVLKAVSSDYSAPSQRVPEGKGTVYAYCTFYIVPAKCSAYKESTLDIKKSISGVSFEKSSDNKYTLSLDEGKSYKLPFAPENGTNKSLVYEAYGSGFTVKNGTVKAYGKGSGTVKVYPADCYDKESMTLTVEVKTSSAPKAIRANTNNISMYPGASQTICLGTVPPSLGRYTYAIHGLNSAYTAEVKGDKLTVTAASDAALPKLNRIAVTIVDGSKNMSGIRNLYISIKGVSAPQNITRFKESNKKLNSEGVTEINIPKGSAYNLGVSAYPASCDTNIIPKVGVGVAADGTLTEGFHEVTAETYDEFTDIYGTGGEREDPDVVTYILTKMDRYYSKAVSGGDPEAVPRPSEDDETAYSKWLSYYSSARSLYNNSNTAGLADTYNMKASGDIISCDAAGTYYLQYTSAAKTASDKQLKSSIYKINVYEPGSTIVMKDMRDTDYFDSNGDKKLTDDDQPMSTENTYTVVGGHLMTSKSADTDTAMTFMGGTTINIAEPYCAGEYKEEIEWKCSKPAAVKISKGADYKTVEGGKSNTYSTLDLQLCQASLTDASGLPIPFTITGTTKYTRQKFSFKISVVNDTAVSEAITDEKAVLSFADESGKEISQPKTMKVGGNFNIFCSSGKEGAAGRVKFTSTNKKVLTVTSNGQVRAVGKGSAAVKAVMTFDDLNTTRISSEVDITVS